MRASENAFEGLLGLDAMVAFAKARTSHRLLRPKLTLQLIFLDPTLTASSESERINEQIYDIIADIAEDLRAQLPPECRSILGTDPADFAAALASATSDGIDEILARLKTEAS